MAANFLATSGSRCIRPPAMLVRNGPGAIALTRTLYGARSTAAWRTMLLTRGLRRHIAVADERLGARSGDRGGRNDAAAALPLHVNGGKPDGVKGRREVDWMRALEQREVEGVDAAVG